MQRYKSYFSYGAHFDSFDFYNDEFSASDDDCVDFNNWIQYEKFLSTSLCYEEYLFLSNRFKGIDLSVSHNKKEVLSNLHNELFRFRLLNEK